MHVINARNVNYALPEGLRLLEAFGEERESRNGPVVVMPGPVTTVYEKPNERVLFDPGRDANPFFHFAEGLWMLAGRNDVATMAFYVARMGNFSDDGETLHGAYGHRWRVHFGYDQLGHIIEALKANPQDRRNVLQMWDAKVDLGRNGKDLPCNTQAYFTRDGSGALDMTVCCRSNDIIMGAYGANAVHFSMLLEYMAGAIGCPVGKYYQMSNNYHAYKADLDKVEHLTKFYDDDFYVDKYLSPYPMVDLPVENWQQDLQMYMSEGMVLGMKSKFFRKVVNPIVMAHLEYKSTKGEKRYKQSLKIIANCEADDWRIACAEWIMRRYMKFQKAQDDGVNYES